MKSARFRVAVILINFNSSEHTLRCIASIRAQTASMEAVQIVVVDNASREEQFQALAHLERELGVTLVRSCLNTGFSGGNMLGTAHADAEFYYFLNNDCLFEEDCIGALLAHCDEHPQTVVCSGHQRHEDGRLRLNFSYFPSLFARLLGTGAARAIWPARYPAKSATYTEALEVPVLAGCSMFVRAEAFAEIGGFDTTYFLYSEEEDLARRLTDAGGRLVLVPGAGFVHLGGGSTPDRIEYLREYYISHLHYLSKYHNGLVVGLHRLLLTVKLLKRSPSLALFVARGAPMRYSLRHEQQIQL